MDAVDVQLKGRVVMILRDVDLADAGHLSDTRREILGDVIGRGLDCGC